MSPATWGHPLRFQDNLKQDKTDDKIEGDNINQRSNNDIIIPNRSTQNRLYGSSRVKLMIILMNHLFLLTFAWPQPDRQIGSQLDWIKWLNTSRTLTPMVSLSQEPQVIQQNSPWSPIVQDLSVITDPQSQGWSVKSGTDQVGNIQDEMPLNSQSSQMINHAKQPSPLQTLVNLQQQKRLRESEFWLRSLYNHRQEINPEAQILPMRAQSGRSISSTTLLNVEPRESEVQNSIVEPPKGSELKQQGISTAEQEKSSSGASDSDAQTSQPTEKVVESRQKKRIFNRILKKAEWNHLFMEISKVLVRYFLDLALKDIIGKQSGSDGTTSRKKLDAQSELADMFKEFVKNAISNI